MSLQTDIERAAKRAARIEKALEDCLGAIDSLTTQVEQMRGMFDDEDGTIQEALDDGEDATRRAEHALGRRRKPFRDPDAARGSLSHMPDNNGRE